MIGAPLKVAVEVATPTARVFRLSSWVAEDEIMLGQPAPFEVGRPVDVTFRLPDGSTVLQVRAELGLGDDDEDDAAGGRRLVFLDPGDAVRLPIRAYVAERLGLP